MRLFSAGKAGDSLPAGRQVPDDGTVPLMQTRDDPAFRSPASRVPIPESRFPVPESRIPIPEPRAPTPLPTAGPGRIVSAMSPTPLPRVGFGYDSHRFVPQRPLVLGGVRIEHHHGLSGHSDADAVLHAIADAILGACSLGDIGEHFSDRDERWRGADSGMILRKVVELAAAAGYRVGNCDVTIITELPKLSPHKPAMRVRIAELLGVAADAVSVKAKTNEGMGSLGRGEGLAAMAVVMMVPKESS